MKKTCIIIVGPTAVGKTDVAIALANFFKTDIISADSRQCYQELTIGVAKPTQEQLSTTSHHFINSHSIQELVTVVDFEKYALQVLEGVFQKKEVVIMAGGTGLYINAFCEGLDAIPNIPDDIRDTVRCNYEKAGMDWLIKAIEDNDETYFKVGEMKNPQRMMRALEVVLATGKSILTFQQKNKINRDFNIIKIGLELPRDILYDRINKRVDAMIGLGLVDEVASLLSFRKNNALQTVGYSEIFDYFDKTISLESAIELIKQHTRNYAKRQMTWFKKDLQTEWFSPFAENLPHYLDRKLKFNS
jgi:tRNA dimethylallyltransferase